MYVFRRALHLVHRASAYTNARPCHEYRHAATSTAMPPASLPTILHELQAQQRLHRKSPATTGRLNYSSEPTGESETKPAATKNDSLAIDRWHNLIRHEREFVFVYKTTQATLLRWRRSALFCPVCNLILNVIPAMLFCEANEGEAKAFPTIGKNHNLCLWPGAAKAGMSVNV